MSQSTAKSERITAILSTLVAVAILAAGVTAHQSHTASQDELTLLESDLRFQLDRAFRHQPKQRAERVAQLDTALKAWRQSPQSSEDRALLSQWLLEATIRSMPGTSEPLPSLPEFGNAKVQVPEKPAEQEPVEPAPLPPAPQDQAPSLGDPFADELAIPSDEILEVSTTEPTANQLTVSVLQTGAAESAPATPQVKKPVEINTTELAARIAGYHQGLDQVETALLTGDTTKLEFLAQQVQQLDELTRDFRFVILYYEALSGRERRNLRAPRSMEATLAELERLLKRVEDGQDGDFLGSIDISRVDQIEQLRQQLAAVAGRVE